MDITLWGAQVRQKWRVTAELSRIIKENHAGPRHGSDAILRRRSESSVGSGGVVSTRYVEEDATEDFREEALDYADPTAVSCVTVDEASAARIDRAGSARGRDLSVEAGAGRGPDKNDMALYEVQSSTAVDNHANDSSSAVLYATDCADGAASAIAYLPVTDVGIGQRGDFERTPGVPDTSLYLPADKTGSTTSEREQTAYLPIAGLGNHCSTAHRSGIAGFSLERSKSMMSTRSVAEHEVEDGPDDLESGRAGSSKPGWDIHESGIQRMATVDACPG